MSDIKELLRQHNFSFNKQFGQNFITDTNLLKAMVGDSGITDQDIVVEIGAGAGTLTKQLALTAKKVYAFEIDYNLRPILNKSLEQVQDNVQLVFQDIMKVDDNALAEIIGNNPYKVVANLPYYITTPILMRFLESANKPESITIMIQKEVAQRLISTSDCGDYGVISLSIALEGQAKITRYVPSQMFMPPPKVDSAVVNIVLNDKYNNVDKAQVKQLFRTAFGMRRKTLVNNLMTLSYSRQDIETCLDTMGLDIRVRGENLSLDQYIQLNTLLRQN